MHNEQQNLKKAARAAVDALIDEVDNNSKQPKQRKILATHFWCSLLIWHFARG